MSARSSANWAVLFESDSDSESDRSPPPVVEIVSTAPVKKTGAKTAKSVRWADGISHPKPAITEVPIPVIPDPTPVKIGFTGDMDVILAEMASGRRSWGDIMLDITEPSSVVISVTAIPDRANKWTDFWALPFADRLQELWGDVYDCSSLTDAEWNEMMRWLFDAGWDVGSYDRNGVEFEEDNGPRRSWIPPEELEAMLEEEAALRRRSYGHCHSHSHAPRKVASAAADVVADAAAPAKKPDRKKSTSSVPRFCREATACKEEGCRYVHGDTIPRVNRPCGFGADCGKGDAAKRSLCLYMHPGETWTDGLVVRRPVAASAAAE